MSTNPSARDALLRLGQLLKARGYTFTPTTPLTHQRVLDRDVGPLGAARSARDLRDVLGWSRPFAAGLDVEVEALLAAAGALQTLPDGRHRSLLRCSTLPLPSESSESPDLFRARGKEPGNRYFHSAFPTDDHDAVFFGPDTVRYAGLARRWLLDRSELGPQAGARPLGRVVDVGAGSGAGALSLAPWATSVVLADINAAALELSRVNAAVAGVDAEVVESDVLDGVSGDIDVVISNPPYLVDEKARAYRHGGARGIELGLRILRAALARLTRGGRVLLYTGSPVVDGQNLFLAAALDEVARAHAVCRVEELDPDVFGESLDEPAYADVERIALVGLLVTLR